MTGHSKQPHVAISRKTQFCASHFYYLSDRSEAENQALFGLCSNRHGHGHNYEVVLTVEGPVHADTGMVCNLKDLKTLLDAAVVEPLEHKNLNAQIPFFQTHMPTLENIGLFVWRSLSDALKTQTVSLPSGTAGFASLFGFQLQSLRVVEKSDLWVEYSHPQALSIGLTPAIQQGNPSPMPHVETPPVTLTRRYEFSASHRLYNPEFSDADNWSTYRECSYINGHGHNYTLEVTVAGVPDEVTGMLVDICALDACVKTHVLDYVDHRHLNLDVSFLAGIIPTAENLVVAFWEQLALHIPPPVALACIRLVETSNNAAAYRGNRQA